GPRVFDGAWQPEAIRAKPRRDLAGSASRGGHAVHAQLRRNGSREEAVLNVTRQTGDRTIRGQGNPGTGQSGDRAIRGQGNPGTDRTGSEFPAKCAGNSCQSCQSPGLRRYTVRDGYGIPIPSARRRRNTRFLSSLRTGNWLAKSATWKVTVNPIPVSPNPGSKATAGAGSPSIPGTSPAACLSTSSSTCSTASGSHSYPTVSVKFADMRFSGR